MSGLSAMSSYMKTMMSWDGPRLSLQALKENVLDRAAHYMSMPSSPTSLSSSSKKKNKDAACEILR